MLESCVTSSPAGAGVVVAGGGVVAGTVGWVTAAGTGGGIVVGATVVGATVLVVVDAAVVVVVVRAVVVVTARASCALGALLPQAHAMNTSASVRRGEPRGRSACKRPILRRRATKPRPLRCTPGGRDARGRVLLVVEPLESIDHDDLRTRAVDLDGAAAFHAPPARTRRVTADRYGTARSHPGRDHRAPRRREARVHRHRRDRHC